MKSSENKSSKDSENRKVGLLFYALYRKIENEVKDEELKKELTKDINKIQKTLNIKNISDKEILLLKEFGVI